MVTNMKRALAYFALTLVSVAAFAAAEEGENFDAMKQYHCVYTEFFRQIPQGGLLGGNQEFTNGSIKQIASLIHDPMRQALIAAAREAYQATGEADPNGKIDPQKYFDVFIDHLSDDLPQHIAVNQCGDGEPLKDALFDVAVNRYVANLLGRGRTYQWFVDNGGVYVYTGFIAAMTAIELSGRKPDMVAWKRYYKEYVQRKFHHGGDSGELG